MDDLISRQAAIDALERQKDKTAKGEIGSFYNTIIQHDIDVIVELPPAQPEIIYCRDCKWADEYNHCAKVTWWNNKDDFCSKAERREE